MLTGWLYWPEVWVTDRCTVEDCPDAVNATGRPLESSDMLIVTVLIP
jgi:hypothetical protein